ncbi:hypothetical protein Fcan01_19938 [Folsomia candida]|uniref:Uncharacterized protein n=1 Tax=Folsomia candida TaxID=158441 RepID=A0A226DIU6_FOLCA|nr:hypothetical protein Fcan01_19938 [Folsomia candida]
MELQNFNVIDNVLEGLNLGQYKEVLQENSIDDSLLKTLHQSGTLVTNLIEVIPSLGHRLQILGALNNQFVDPQFEIILDPETLPATNSASENNSDENKSTLESTHDSEKESNLESIHDNGNDPTLEHDIETMNNLDPNNQIPNDNFDISSQEMYEFRKKSAEFVVKLKSNGKLSLATCNEIINSVSKLFNEALDLIAKIVKQPDPKSSIFEEQINQLKDPFAIVKTDYLLKKYLTEMDFYTPPKEIILGSQVITRPGSVVQFDKFYYVPIKRVLEKVLCLPGIMEHILEVNQNIPHKLFVSQALILYNVESCIPVIPKSEYGDIHGIETNGNCINIYSEENCVGQFVRLQTSRNFRYIDNMAAHRWEDNILAPMK